MKGSHVLVSQFSDSSEPFRKLLQMLFLKPHLERVRMVVAYARWEGLGLISDEVLKFLQAGGRLETIFGAGNGVTSLDALYFGMVLQDRFPGQTYAGFVEDEYANATFHPKIYEFRYRSETIVIVGSANLTGGGLCRNIEAGVSLACVRGSEAEKEWASYWEKVFAKATKITASSLRDLALQPGVGREGADESRVPNDQRPRLKQTKPGPLFAEILKLKSIPKHSRHELLGEMSGLSEKPNRLYIEIFPRETGGNHGEPGTAVQFPVATLGAFFGISPDDYRSVQIDFKDSTINPHFMHPNNKTHRLRIQAILGVNRPAVLILDRLAVDHYKGYFAKNFAHTIKTKCTEQRRSGSRRWGFED